MLFDDEEQIEVRHVISLAHHNVSIYSGGDVTPEGELFIKRNALCLSRRTEGVDLAPDAQLSKPFYLFSENCSAKEDFYFALLRNQEQSFGATLNVPPPKNFQVKDIISLVQKLHSSEDNVHTRWLNALIGRVFLSIYKTRDLEAFISDKMTKKISRVKRPSFLTNITIRKIDTGEAAPQFTNLKLKDLNVDGEYVAEADVKYTGNFRIEVAATAKFDLGPRFKAREVNLVLSVTLKRVEGHVLFKIKPPPSNRLWLSFQTMPKMEMRIEPIVSSRQITYTVIIRQIENRIKEVVAETLVQPFWDDLPFFNTEHKKWRGGIFEGDDEVVIPAEPDSTQSSSAASAAAHSEDVDAVDRAEKNTGSSTDVGDQSQGSSTPSLPLEKSYTMPIADISSSQSKPQSPGTGLFGRKKNSAAGSQAPSPASASSTSIDTKPASHVSTPAPAPAPAPAAPASPAVAPSPKSLNQTTAPVVGTDAAHADLYRPSTSPPDNATNYMAALHSRSQEVSPANTPGTTPPLHRKQASYSSNSSALNEVKDENDKEKTPISKQRRNTASSTNSSSTAGGAGDIPSGAQSPSSSKSATLGRNFFARKDSSTVSIPSFKGEGNDGEDGNKSSGGNGASSPLPQKKNTLAAVTNAAVQARQWGWNAIQRQKDGRKMSDASSQQHVDLSQPMGRGQPLPPPGTPLPGPTNGKTKITPIPVPKRKPVTSSGQETSPGASAQESTASNQHGSGNHGQRRRRKNSHFDDEDAEQSMLVVAAPDDSDSDTPAIQEGDEYDMSQEMEATGIMEVDDKDAGPPSSPAAPSVKGDDSSEGTTPPPATVSKEVNSVLEPPCKDGPEENATQVQAQEVADDATVDTSLPESGSELAEASEAALTKAPTKTSHLEQNLHAPSSNLDDEDISGWMEDTGDESSNVTGSDSLTRSEKQGDAPASTSG